MKKDTKGERSITYAAAVNEALRQEMQKDKRVFIYGIDVADHKRTFGTNEGILEKFGPQRCFSTPLAEDALMGFGVGAAISGMRPINVHMRIDFTLLTMNQLANMAASYHYGSGGTLSVPLVVRTIVGRGWGQAYQHSKTLHSFFGHIPGLKVVMPTTPYDAKGLMIAAIRDNNPVVVIEHRWLYYQTGIVPKEDYMVPIGKANVLRRGKDVTVVATSWMNVEAAKAADILAKRGIHIEIVDPRAVFPLDEATIVASVKKTGRCVVADNDWVHCGFGAEIAARVAEKCFGCLKAPIERVGFAAAPCPTVRALENEFYPNAGKIIRAVERQLKLKPMDLTSEQFYSYENKFKGPF
jgi:pyruvate dehydrogenase E1 component beta subunit